MSTYKFYGKNTEELTSEQFVEKYNSSYYLGQPKLVAGVSQNSKVTEDEIDHILCDGIRSQLDIYHILAWKVGKIKHAESDASNRFVYASDWTGIETGVVNRFGKELDLTGLAIYIVEDIRHLEEQAKNDPQGVLEGLRKEAPPGIGTVYLITLLYFISRGTWPSYDRFAMMALSAIAEGKKPGEPVKYVELPDKNSGKFHSVMDICKQTYIKQLEDIFGKEYSKDRNVDRALWVYGHCFKKG